MELKGEIRALAEDDSFVRHGNYAVSASAVTRHYDIAAEDGTTWQSNDDEQCFHVFWQDNNRPQPEMLPPLQVEPTRLSSLWFGRHLLGYILGALLIFAGGSGITGLASHRGCGLEARQPGWPERHPTLFGGLVGNLGGIRSAALLGLTSKRKLLWQPPPQSHSW